MRERKEKIPTEDRESKIYCEIKRYLIATQLNSLVVKLKFYDIAVVHSLCFRESFKRAFSAAILGDVLNICCILIVLPIELTTGETFLHVS